MRNKTVLFLLVASFFTTIFFTQNIAAADTVSDLRLQLQTVLNRINELTAELTLIESGVTTTGSCISINQNLSKGMDNSEVKKLQIFLAQNRSIYPEAITSGYFGSLTELAVQRWQAQYGVISYGAPSTTGYGAVGPKTRAAIAAACGGAGGYVAGADNVVSFSFSETSGQAPATPVISIAMLEASCMSYKIDWGDNSTPTEYSATKTTNCSTGIATKTTRHTYVNAGNYTATLYAGKGSVSALPQVTLVNISITAGQPFVEILSPNGDETLRLGDITKIKWQVANQPEDSAIVFYIIGSDGTYRFAKRSHSTQEFDWIVGDRVCDGNGCDVQLPAGSTYTMRAALYTPANACIDFCNGSSITPHFLATDESDNNFIITQLGSSGSNPLSVLQTTGKAPFTAAMTVKIAPVSNGVGNFEVDFGDGSSPYYIHIPAGESRTTERTISHTYSNIGSYYIRLRPVGAVQHIAEERITVTEPSFSVSPSTQVIAPVTVAASFKKDTACSHLSDITRVYTVDWGDGTEDSRYEVQIDDCTSTSKGKQHLSLKSFEHDYPYPGTYYPEFTVAVDGVYYRQVETVVIEKAELSVSPSFGFNPLTTTASFSTDESCVMGDTTNVTYTLDWGDGTTKAQHVKALPSCDGDFSINTVDKDYTHTYREIGRYTVTLTVKKDSISTSYSRSKEVVVDTSVLRNGVRKLAQSINNLNIGENMAAAISAILAK